MLVRFSPRRAEGALHVVKAGDALSINGEGFDFSGLIEGGVLPAGVVPCPWISGEVARRNGVLELTLVLPHGPNPSEAVAFPQSLLDPPDGELAIPSDPAEEASHVDG